MEGGGPNNAWRFSISTLGHPHAGLLGCLGICVSDWQSGLVPACVYASYRARNERTFEVRPACLQTRAARCAKQSHSLVSEQALRCSECTSVQGAVPAWKGPCAVTGSRPSRRLAASQRHAQCPRHSHRPLGVPSGLPRSNWQSLLSQAVGAAAVSVASLSSLILATDNASQRALSV